MDLAKAGKIAGMDADARQEQLEAQQNVQRALLNFEEAIQKIRNKIFNQLLDSGLFDKFAEIMGKLQNKFTDFMNSKDNSHMWPRTLQYIDNMDSIRQTNWKKLLID